MVELGSDKSRYLHIFGCSFRNIELSLSLESWAHFEIRYFKFMERVGIELLGDIWSSDPLIYFDVSLNRIETFNYVKPVHHNVSQLKNWTLDNVRGVRIVTIVDKMMIFDCE